MSTLPWRARKKPLLNITAGNKDMHLQTSDLSFELGSVFCCFQEPELVVKKYCRRTIIPRNRHSSLHVCPQKSIFHVSFNSNAIDIGNSNHNISYKCSQDKKNISCSKNNVELRKRKANIYASGSCWGTCMLQKSLSCVHLNSYEE